jgi:hypothetical protein
MVFVPRAEASWAQAVSVYPVHLKGYPIVNAGQVRERQRKDKEKKLDCQQPLLPVLYMIFGSPPLV